MATPRMKVTDGDIRRWYLGQQRHRDDGPAVEYPNGDYVWYDHGKFHRDGAPAARVEGKYLWAQYDELHRVDGPAVYEVQWEY